MKTDGGGWTVFQRRQDGSVDFFRGWNDYKIGFGNVRGEFWLGLDKIHWLLGLSNGNELRIELMEENNVKNYAKYRNFSMGNEKSKYVLHISGFNGTIRDSLAYHNGREFSTKDRGSKSDCAKSYQGAWWYGACYDANLNGVYGRNDLKTVAWYRKDVFKKQVFTEMKFRSK